MKRLALSSAALLAGMAILTYGAPASHAVDVAPPTLSLEITSLLTSPGQSSTAQAVNNLGDVAGQRGAQAVYWKDGSATDLGTLPGDTSSVAYGLNDCSTVVGASIGTARGEPSFQAFRWTPSDGISAVGSLGGDRSEARDVNVMGVAVGYAATKAGALHAFRSDPGSPMVDLGTLDGFRNSEALAINGANQIVGVASSNTGDRRAFIWASGEMTALPLLPGGNESVAYDINDAGQVVGVSNTTGGSYHAFLWSADAGVQDLGPVESGDRLAIDSAGDVLTSPGRVWHNGSWFDLARLMAASDPTWQLLSASDLNSSGQVAGQARNQSSDNNVAILVTPSISLSGTGGQHDSHPR